MTSLKVELSLNKEISENPKELIDLFRTNEKVLKNPIIKILAVLLPTVLIGTIIFSWFEMFIITFFLNIILFLALFIFVSRSISPLYKFKKAMINIKNIVELITKTEFEAELNKQTKEILVNEDALKNINKISFLAEAVNVRHNFILYLILNFGLLWDINIATYLEELRGKIDIEKWLKQVAHFEAMLTLANVSMQENTSYPKLTHENKITSELLAHPLIENPVANSITLDGIAIVSGSNMSGKTTFLRTIGINLVLFYAGSAVCATKFEAPRLAILTSMRIADNLEESISTFYAELIRIEKIIKKSKTKEPMIFLIDEIFRGTNSEDRITGAKKVLEQLNKNLGLITTHDLEVSNNFEGKHGFVNLHFKEEYVDNKISFDYKMRKGISTTRNAIYLMKMVGIE
ncbi:MAG: DNA mismatch repair protein MutS, partial [Defluviitaleaceae bacterium]|nr:DNA mismatch repair protein MutS [Defluviitaleaceae bacterium]